MSGKPVALGSLLHGFDVEATVPWRNLQVTGLSEDSRKVKPGNLFCALVGDAANGRDFIEEVVEEKRAAAVLVDGQLQDNWRFPQPQLAIRGLRPALGRLAARFWDHPSASMKLIAVTGTNGKTSTCLYLAQALNLLGHPCGVIGTLGAGPLSEVMSRPAANAMTTPAAIDLQSELHALRDKGIEAATLEASSHGLDQHRLAGTQVDLAVLTNITQDHLEYHGNLAAYKAAKQRLFREFPLQGAVLNADDPVWQEFRDGLPEGLRYMTYSLSGEPADIRCEKISYLADGLSLRFRLLNERVSLRVPLFGKFAAANLLATAGALCLLGHSFVRLRQALSSVVGAPGRMEKFTGVGGCGVFIDYAHTPDALRLALTSLREHTRGQLWCVFGCGGERDRWKRPAMGQVASRHADCVVLTDDNPRHEDGENIVRDIQQGIPGSVEVQVRRDRAEAIRLALAGARQGDVVLVAGKGHETLQEVNGSFREFSDRAVVVDCLGASA